MCVWTAEYCAHAYAIVFVITLFVVIISNRAEKSSHRNEELERRPSDEGDSSTDARPYRSEQTERKPVDILPVDLPSYDNELERICTFRLRCTVATILW